MKRKRSYSRVTHQALSIFGKLIRIARTERGMRAQELADRAGISRTTLYNIERGTPGTEIGVTFEVAALVGVSLFDSDHRLVNLQDVRLKEKLTLLPKSIRRVNQEVDDDF